MGSCASSPELADKPGFHGRRRVEGSFDSNGFVFNLDMKSAAGDDGWLFVLENPDSAGASGTVYAALDYSPLG